LKGFFGIFLIEEAELIDKGYKWNFLPSAFECADRVEWARKKLGMLKNSREARSAWESLSSDDDESRQRFQAPRRDLIRI